MFDQAISSGSNFLVTVAVGRFGGPKELGLFTLAFLFWLLALGVGQALVCQPMTLRSDSGRLPHYVRSMLTVAAAFAIIGVSMGLGSAAVGIAAAPLALAAALAIPGLLLQDLVRCVAFSRSREIDAVRNDAVFAGLAVIGLGLLILAGRVTAVSALLVWGGAGAIAAVAGLGSLGIGGRSWLPSPRALRGDLGYARWLLLDFLANFSIGQLYLVLAAALASVEVLGGFRAIQNLFGPTNLLLLGVAAVSTARSANAARAGDDRASRRITRAYGAMTAAGVLAFGAVLWLLSRPVVVLVYGPAFGPFAAVVPLVAADLFVRSLRQVPQVRLKVIERVRVMAVAKLLALGPALAGAGVLLHRGGVLSVGLSAVWLALLWTGSTWIAYTLTPPPAARRDRPAAPSAHPRSND